MPSNSTTSAGYTTVVSGILPGAARLSCAAPPRPARPPRTPRTSNGSRSRRSAPPPSSPPRCFLGWRASNRYQKRLREGRGSERRVRCRSDCLQPNAQRGQAGKDRRDRSCAAQRGAGRDGSDGTDRIGWDGTGRDRTRVVEVVLPLERLALLLGRQHLVEAVLAEDQHFALPPLHLVLPQQLHDLLAHCGLRAADQRAAPANRTPIAPPAVPRARSRPHFAAGGAAADADEERLRVRPLGLSAAGGGHGGRGANRAERRCRGGRWEM